MTTTIRKHRTLSGKLVDDADPTDYSLAILNGMQGRPVFGGLDANHPTKSTTKRLAARRARNKAARISRRANRVSA